MTVMPPSLRFAAAVAALAMLGACSDSATVVPRPPGGDFILQASDGPLDSRTLRGKVLLVYFGYVNCPDVCPVSIAAGAGALNALSPAERERTRMIMVSVDPERDTPAALKTYVAYFHPQMLGAVGNASGNRRRGEAVRRRLCAPADAARRRLCGGPFLADLRGRSRGAAGGDVPLGTPTEKIAVAVRKLL
jgi:protein SCO1/2